FGMGTGVTFSPSSPDYLIKERSFAFAKIFVPSKLDNVRKKKSETSIVVQLWLLASRVASVHPLKSKNDFNCWPSSACRGCTVASAFRFG
ncbi:hypothetical protein M3181_26005, partial [Mesobacillus maritimus]|uniref:hypothetical protein n=1 Tax=Mesobacillus maritimus TaxID=1643336 RepID=UPI00203DFD68